MSTGEEIGVNWRLGDDIENETMGHIIDGKNSKLRAGKMPNPQDL
jgi:hypothetical protein